MLYFVNEIRVFVYFDFVLYESCNDPSPCLYLELSLVL